MLALNALWDDMGVGTQLLGLTLNAFLFPFSGVDPRLSEAPLHRQCWRVVEQETQASAWGDVAAADGEESLQRVLCHEPGDEYMQPRGRLVPEDEFTADRTDLPDLGEKGKAGRCSVIESGPPFFKHWSDPCKLERLDADREEARSTPAAVGVSVQELGLLYLRMVAHCMIAGWTGAASVVNGIFGVYKDFGPEWAVRLIIEARRFNRRLIESPYVPLVTPSGLAASLRQMLRARPRKERRRAPRLWAGKRDVSCCFYRCLLPRSWHRFLGLPRVRASQVWASVEGKRMRFPTPGGGPTVWRRVRPGDWVFPLLGVVAMGLSHAVFLVQVLHEWIIRRVPAIRRAARPREWGLRPREMYRSLLAGVIVDDLYLLSVKSREEVDQALAEVEPIYDQHGWVAKESKREPAALQGRKITGVMVEGADLALRPPKERLWDVSVAPVQLVRKGTVSVAAVDRAVHVLGWYFLLVRPSLSIFRDSYRWIEENRGG
ncbi:MAG: hypothetical protein VYB51_04315, partial [Gemmatimonadota bacterium]|nr:hypothetical protein [Gemmatimonadota bacterium]